MKILSPAGNFECLKMAVLNGANEVYLGINKLNARNNIDGFTIETLKDAIDYAHIFDVKVHQAINILFSNEELQEALDTIVDAYNLGVDAFIIQDLGLVSLVNKLYPEIEIHASTQMGIHNLEGVKAIEKFGFKRVVLSRETPLSEIKRINKNTNIELEYFAQGALCVSFSGNCYLSSYLCDASGNRGKCKQLCRLPYTLQNNGKDIKTGYLLSAKDFNMIDKLNSLKEAGIDVIKIEGRARRPFYVATATKEYFNAINNLKTNPEDLKLAFNRDYTPGYFDGNDKIISKFQNHIGVKIGNIEKVVFGKNFNEVYFSSNRELSAKSSFKIFSENQEKNTLTAYDLKNLSNGKYKLTTTQKVKVGDQINLIVDFEKENKTLNFNKRKTIEINLSLIQNQPISATFEYNLKTYTFKGDICQVAQNQPISRIDLENNFNKNELFEAKLSFSSLENVFMPKQKINEFRRYVFENIYSIITKQSRNLQKTCISTNYIPKKFTNFEYVEDVDQTFKAKNIIYSPETYQIEDIEKFIEKCKTENVSPFLDLPNFALEDDIKLLKEIVDKTKIGIVANNYYALDFNTPNIIIGAGLNVYNNFTAELYNKPIITAESDLSTKIDFPYMTLRHCPMKNHLNATCNKCPYNKNYTYKMDNGKILKLKRKKLSTCTFYLTD